MIYRKCKIMPEFMGFSWSHPDNPGPNDDGTSEYSGHSMTVEGCKAQIDDLYAEHLDEPQDEFQLWAGTRQ